MVRARGFSSFEALDALFNDTLSANPKAKKIEVEVSAKYILSLVKSNDHLLSDHYRNAFLTLLRGYMREVAAAKGEPSTSSAANDTLSVIRDHCIFLGNLRLGSEANPKVSLSEWSKESEGFENEGVVVLAKERAKDRSRSGSCQERE